MEEKTPTFGSYLFDIKKSKFRFSELCDSYNLQLKTRKMSEGDKFINSEFHHKKGKSKKKKTEFRSKTEEIPLKSNSQKFKNVEEISDIKVDNAISKRKKKNNKCKFFQENLNNFIRNHKFLLRDDFNEKKVSQFLSSKEAAFEMPIISNSNINFNNN